MNMEYVEDEIINVYQKMSTDELLLNFDDVYQLWVVKTKDRLKNNENNILKFTEVILSNYGLNVDNLQRGVFDKTKLMLAEKICYLRFKLQSSTELSKNEKNEILRKFNEILKILIDAENMIKYMFFLKSSILNDDEIDVMDLNRYNPMINMETNKPYQNLLLYLLECLEKEGYRRYKGECYKKVYTENGYDTYFWERECSLREFIMRHVKKEINFQMWQNLTSAKGLDIEAARFLEQYIGNEFRDLKKNRNVFSFNDGIFMLSESKFIPYNSEEYNNLKTSFVSCKYFKLNFDASTLENKNILNYRYNNWFNIIIDKCPYFKKIMDDQQWPSLNMDNSYDPNEDNVQRWFCVLLGRLLYNLGEHDDWQIMPFLLGQAGTGKSTLITRVVKLFYCDVDIGTLSNNTETKFGLSALEDKFILIGPEINDTFCMEQSEFQSIISGEDIQINVKNRIAHSVKWKVPGIIAGNTVPRFNDNSGSISRRLAVFSFKKRIKTGDTQLGRKLQNEIGYILHACNRAYLEAINIYDSTGIWEILPKYFKETSEEMAENINALDAFIKSDKLIMGKDFYMKEEDFKNEFNEFTKINGYSRVKWTKQYALVSYEKYGLHCAPDKLHYPPKSDQLCNCIFIKGIDFKRQQDDYE